MRHVLIPVGLLTIALTFSTTQAAPATQPAREPAKVLLLPFVSADSAPGLEWLGRGIIQTMQADLSRTDAVQPMTVDATRKDNDAPAPGEAPAYDNEGPLHGTYGRQMDNLDSQASDSLNSLRMSSDYVDPGYGYYGGGGYPYYYGNYGYPGYGPAYGYGYGYWPYW